MSRDRETVTPTPAPLLLLLVLAATVPNQPWLLGGAHHWTDYHPVALRSGWSRPGKEPVRFVRGGLCSCFVVSSPCNDTFLCPVWLESGEGGRSGRPCAIQTRGGRRCACAVPHAHPHTQALDGLGSKALRQRWEWKVGETTHAWPPGVILR